MPGRANTRLFASGRRFPYHRGTRSVRGFLDDRQVFEYVDATDDAVFEGGSAYFFIDDRATVGEEAAGAVTRLRIWDAPGGK